MVADIFKNLQRKATGLVLRALAMKGTVTLPLRHRYVFTRHNRLRLRYIVPPCAVFMAAFMITALSSSGLSALQVAGQKIPRAQDSSLMAGTIESQEQRLASISPAAGRSHAGQQGAVNQAVPEEKVTAALEPQLKELEVGRGDTLGGMLQKAGLSGGEAHRAVSAVQAHYDPRQIRAGQVIKLRFDPVTSAETPQAEPEYQFAEMVLPINALKTVSLQRGPDDEFESAIEEKPVEKNIYAAAATIDLSLYGSALKASIPAAVISEAIKIYSWDVDFQRDIRKGDLLEVMYEQYETADGVRVKSGDILYVRLNVNGRDLPVYRFELEDGHVDYFTADGQSLRKALMRTPIDGARLSSGFGMRHHPILGYDRMHRGVDFAAPTGTPIYAAGDGTIERIGRNGGYGNYIRIRHNSTLKTAYAHLHNFASGLSNGSRVRQGQVIGYVGTTGRSTGPHLHYEVLMNGEQVNPNSVDVPQGETLKGQQLAKFREQIKKFDREFKMRTGNTKYAALTHNARAR